MKTCMEGADVCSEFNQLIVKDTLREYYQKLWDTICKEESIYLFGASEDAKMAIKWIESKNDGNFSIKNIKGIFDNDSHKVGQKIRGIDVISPNDLVGDGRYKYNNETIMITSGSGHQIIPQLNKIGVSNDRICIYTLFIQNYIGEFSDYFAKHKKDFEYVYETLEDGKSKRVFINLINFKLSANFDKVMEIADEKEDQYFDENIISFSDEDIYLDCGAYTGDTARYYVDHNRGKYKKIISVEADPNTFERMRKNTENYKIECINKGVWNYKTTLKFQEMESGAGNSISSSGNIEIEVDTIDHIVGEQKITHIKMDIEGSEIPALIGAYNTIMKNHPTLAICVYHKVDDYITIPLLIKAIRPEYRLFFRQYQKMSAVETICYAVYPKNE